MIPQELSGSRLLWGSGLGQDDDGDSGDSGDDSEEAVDLTTLNDTQEQAVDLSDPSQVSSADANVAPSDTWTPSTAPVSSSSSGGGFNFSSLTSLFNSGVNTANQIKQVGQATGILSNGSSSTVKTVAPLTSAVKSPMTMTLMLVGAAALAALVLLRKK